MLIAGNLGDFMWSLLIIFFMIAYFMILFHVIVDIFRRKDSGGKKALWIIFIFVAPFLGLLIYLIANGQSMGERDLAAAQQSQAAFDDYVRQTAGGGSAAEIEKAKALLDSGAITQAEYDALKAKALAA